MRGEAKQFHLDHFVQGSIGNCWILSALGSIIDDQETLKFLFPDTNDSQDFYGTVVIRCYCKDGKWEEGLIDHRLCASSYSGELVFTGPSEMCEEDHLILWAMYIEKYLAKGFGSFESIEGGYMDEAFTLFTDGTTLSLRLFEEQPRTVLMLLEHVLALNGFAAAATENSQNTELLKNLQTGHAYAILDVYYVDVEAGAANRGVAFKEILLRIRNPHGQKSPNVAWSNKNHSLWSRVSKATKERVGYHRLHSGEFFFAFSDFCRHFEILQICNNSLPPTAGVFVRGQQTTEVFTLDGCWELGYSAGGSDDHEHAPFVTNPSFVSK